jgi:hypothetical protein
MQDRRLAKWSLVLKTVVCAVLLFSAAIMLLPAQTQLLFNLVAFGGVTYPAEIPVSARPYVVFVYRVLGAVMIGWMLAVLALVHIPFRRGEPWAWWAITLSVGGWFVIDTSASLLSGYPGNALLNLCFGVAFAVPLLATRSMARVQL